jgi:hypothetical protein
VKQSDLGEYEKIQEKSKIYNIQVKSTNSPSNQAIWMANTNPPPKISKSRRIDGFGENIGQLSLGVYVRHLNVPLLYMISQKVVSPLNMSHLFMKDLIFVRGTLSNHTPKSLIVCTIQRICEQQLAAATYSASVVDYVTEDYF